MAVEIKWTLHALHDIESIAEFIAQDSEHFAVIQINKFFIRSQILEKFSFAGRVVPELGDEHIRELIEGNYRIIYRVVSKNRVDILTIHQSYQLLSSNPLFKK